MQDVSDAHCRFIAVTCKHVTCSRCPEEIMCRSEIFPSLEWWQCIDPFRVDDGSISRYHFKSTNFGFDVPALMKHLFTSLFLGSSISFSLLFIIFLLLLRFSLLLPVAVMLLRILISSELTPAVVTQPLTWLGAKSSIEITGSIEFLAEQDISHGLV